MVGGLWSIMVVDRSAGWSCREQKWRQRVDRSGREETKKRREGGGRPEYVSP